MSATRQQILNSQFSEWYPLFDDVSFKSEVVPLPSAFVRWLKQDKVSLPPGTTSSLFCSDKTRDGALSSDDEEWSDEVPQKLKEASSSLSEPPVEAVEEDEAAATAAGSQEAKEVFDFTGLDTQVRTALARLYGGSSDNTGKGFFVKLNWSAPQDAAWLNMGSLKCQQPGDAYLLIKASDFCAHDLNFPFDGCCDEGDDNTSSNCDGSSNRSSNSQKKKSDVAYTLVLRKWCNLRPERGFRCFVKNRHLVGVSQRDCTVHYPQLEADAPRIRTAIVEFLASHGRSKANKRAAGREVRTTGAAAEAAESSCSSSSSDSGSGSRRDGHSKTSSSAAHSEDKSTRDEPLTLLERLLDANAVLDVYVDAAFKVWLVDVNAWSKTTDSLLFSWDAPPLSNDDAVKGPAEDSATVVAAVPTSPETPSVCAASADASIEGRNEVADPANPPVVGAHAATSSPSSSDAPPAASLVSSAPLDDAELRLVAASDGGAVRASPMAEYRAPLEMHLFAQALQGGGSAPANGSSNPPGDGGLGGMADFQAFMARCERETKEGRHSDSSSDNEK